MKHCTSRHNVG